VRLDLLHCLLEIEALQLWYTELSMNLSLNSRPWASWLRPSCWSREKLRLELRFTLVFAAGLIILGFTFSALIYLIYASTGNPVTWKQALSVGLAQWWVWSLLYLLLFRFIRRFPFERQRWLQGLSVYLLLGFAVTLVKLGIDVIWIRLVYQGVFFKHPSERSLLPIMTYFNFVTYWVFVGVGQALNFYRQVREGELKASQLETQLAQSQLQALRMQLQPHFLFNTLHTIAMLNLKDSKAANRMISRLSDLLRLTLDNGGAQEVTLKDELEFLKRYLEIQEIRFQDRLSVSLDIDPESLDARVPNLILQPIVENAILHGIAEQESNGRIEIQASRQNGWLQLQVRDNGSGIPTAAPNQFKEGIGLGNTRARLKQHFGAAHRFELVNSDSGGLEVSITIPFREDPLSTESPKQDTDNDGKNSRADSRR
jgi:two-component system LytT family sensor kinase